MSDADKWVVELESSWGEIIFIRGGEISLIFLLEVSSFPEVEMGFFKLMLVTLLSPSICPHRNKLPANRNIKIRVILKRFVFISTIDRAE